MWSRWACVTNTVLLYTARCVQRRHGLPCPAAQRVGSNSDAQVVLAHLRAAAGVKHQLVPRQDDAGLLAGDADAIDLDARQSEGRLPPCMSAGVPCRGARDTYECNLHRLAASVQAW